MKLSIVILNWNGSRLMQEYLPAVLTHSRGVEGVEVVVADNASTDDSLSVLRRDFPEVRLILLDRNYGFAEGYNRALQNVESEYSLLLNSDVEPAAGWLPPLLDFMDAHPGFSACQPKIRSLRERSRFEFAGACGGWIDAYGYPFCRGRMMEVVEEDRGQYDIVSEIFWATGAALLVRTADFRALGGFDARFFAHMEEIDFCWRLNALGKKIACVPQSVVYHLGGGTLNKSNPRKTFLNFRNNLWMLYKNLPESRLRPVLRVRLLLDYVAALSFLLQGKWGDCRAVLRARRAFRASKAGFKADRARLQREATCANWPGFYPKSLLIAYYLKRITTFGKLFAGAFSESASPCPKSPGTLS